MANRMSDARLDAELETIEAAIRRHPDGLTARQLGSELEGNLPHRTLQYRLKLLVTRGRLVQEGAGRRTRYRATSQKGAKKLVFGDRLALDDSIETSLPLSERSIRIRDYVRQPLAARTPVGYRREFLDSYQPSVSFHLSPEERAGLHEIGRAGLPPTPAGTHARQILSRLLIDLSWNSSRLEGNTYSLLDTKRLLDLGEAAEHGERIEAQMILNHKDAIEFLVEEAGRVGFNRYTILNLHAMLAHDLLPDRAAEGRLRRIAVGIGQSVFQPLQVPQLIEECFDRILATAAAIEDPFEQSFFFMAQLPCLQPFEDVNKRVSRLGANIPFIKHNLSPLSFADVPRSVYTQAVLGVYELNRIDLLKDVFLWAYKRSAARYGAVRQEVGEPDPFRVRHRTALRELVGNVVREGMDVKTATAYIAGWVQANVEPAEGDRLRNEAEGDLLALHEGNYARYWIRPAEFTAWRRAWEGTAA